MNTIHVRRSGLVAFASRIGSTITGLIFVVIVTRNLPPLEFGLWQLVSRTIGYVLIPTAILGFWLTRYRARGMSVGRTAVVSGLLFSAVLTVIYLIISFPISGSVSAVSSLQANFFFFLISTPQVLLYVLSGALEAVLWGVSPEKGSYGFASFEIAKVIIGYVTVSVLHLSLTGAIITVIAAQIVQMLSLMLFTKGEYGATTSFETIRSMLKTGWLAILNNIHPLVINMDFLVVGIITASTLPLALYGSAVTIGNVVQFSSALAAGLYPSILSGRDPTKPTSQILELQLIFLAPMALGAILLSYQLLALLNPAYVSATLILAVLTVGACFSSVQMVQDSVIAGSDTTDVNSKVKMSLYFKGKLFLLAKINLVLAAAYLAGVAVDAHFFGIQGSSPNISSFDLLGLLWATAGAGMYAVGFVVKAIEVRKITHISISASLVRSIIVSSIVFSVVLLILSHFLLPGPGQPSNGTLIQALLIFATGLVSLAAYGAVMYTMDATARNLVRAVIRTFIRPSISNHK